MKSEKYKTILMLFLFAACFPVWPAGAERPLENNRRLNFGLLLQDYKWAEYADNGNKLLEESGNIYSLAFDLNPKK